MASTTPDEEIIERRPSHPVSTACLILSAAAMLGAIVFQVIEIGEVRAGVSRPMLQKENPAKEFTKQQLTDFTAAANKVVADSEHAAELGKPAADGEKADEAAPGEENAAPPAAKKAAPPMKSGKAAKAQAAAETAEPAETPAEAEEKPSEPPAEPTDAGKPDEGTKSDAPAEEKKADDKGEPPAADAGAEKGGGATEETPAGGDEKGQ
jgi:hypothetical protein